MRLSDFDYELPESLIAQHPTAQRSASRLLHLPAQGDLQDLGFQDLAQLLRPGDLLVFNNSRVIPARLAAQKDSGGQVEVLVERILPNDQVSVLLRVSRKPQPGSQLQVLPASGKPPTAGQPGPSLTVLGRDPEADDRFLLQCPGPVLPLLEAWGSLPLPPYIEHQPGSDDAERYQTVYAQTPGSIAAPTAGLHFDQPLLDRLAKLGVAQAQVTLHVGSGTFAPVKHEDLDQHVMHREWCSIGPEVVQAIADCRARGGRVVAVGTTSLRTLESAAARHAGQLRAEAFDTQLFIRPGYGFQVVDALVTNFHLPKSTLLMLVSAFSGHARIRAAYAHAIAHGYRFFSYGDAMLLERPGA